MVFLIASIVAAGEAAAQQSAADDAEAGTLVEAVAGGTISLGFRYRYEFVELDGGNPDAHASTLRTALSLRTRPWNGFDFLLEAENVAALDDDRYRDAGRPPRGNGVSDRPVVADPAGTDINQVALGYRFRGTQLRVGRQEINIGDQRFVGAVGWRQHHQTFSGINVENASLDDVTLRYAFVNNVYRVFGDKLGAAHHFFDATWRSTELGGLNGYAFLLDYEEPKFGELSTTTVGAEFAGSRNLRDGLAAYYEFEYAHQVDAGSNPAELSVSYAHLMGGVGLEQWLAARVGWEMLGGGRDNGRFTTPLATLHKFNGWADQFLTTPPEGLRDTYVQLDGRVRSIAWLLAYHRFGADGEHRRYGDEVDWQVAWTSSWRQTFAFKGAAYAASTFSTDTLKIWLYSTYTFGPGS